MENEFSALVKLSPQERIEIYTLMSQWARDLELQAIKVMEWWEKRSALMAKAVAEATAEYIFAPAKYRFEDNGLADIAQRAAERLKP